MHFSGCGRHDMITVNRLLIFFLRTRPLPASSVNRFEDPFPTGYRAEMKDENVVILKLRPAISPPMFVVF